MEEIVEKVPVQQLKERDVIAQLHYFKGLVREVVQEVEEEEEVYWCSSGSFRRLKFCPYISSTSSALYHSLHS